jgi:hypothetical protein
MSDFRKDGRRFQIAPAGAGWAWSVRDLDGGRSRAGRAATRAEAAARIVSATLADVDWPSETGMTGYRRPDERAA